MHRVKVGTSAERSWHEGFFWDGSIQLSAVDPWAQAEISSKPSEAILVAFRPLKLVETRDGGWGMVRGRIEHNKTARRRQRTPRRSYGEHGESHGENHDKTATTSRACMRETSCRFLHAFFSWFRSRLVEVHFDSCLGALLRIEEMRPVRLCHWRFHKRRKTLVDELRRDEWYIQDVSSPRRWGSSALLIWACPDAPGLQNTWFALINVKNPKIFTTFPAKFPCKKIRKNSLTSFCRCAGITQSMRVKRSDPQKD